MVRLLLWMILAQEGAMDTVWKILSIVLIIVAILELIRTEGYVTRPIAVLCLVLAALEAIFLFGIVGVPGTIGIVGWMAILSTAIFIFSIELMRISGGFRGAPLAILMF